MKKEKLSISSQESRKFLRKAFSGFSYRTAAQTSPVGQKTTQTVAK